MQAKITSVNLIPTFADGYIRSNVQLDPASLADTPLTSYLFILLGGFAANLLVGTLLVVATRKTAFWSIFLLLPWLGFIGSGADFLIISRIFNLGLGKDSVEPLVFFTGLAVYGCVFIAGNLELFGFKLLIDRRRKKSIQLPAH